MLPIVLFLRAAPHPVGEGAARSALHHKGAGDEEEPTARRAEIRRESVATAYYSAGFMGRSEGELPKGAGPGKPGRGRQLL